MSSPSSAGGRADMVLPLGWSLESRDAMGRRGGGEADRSSQRPEPLFKVVSLNDYSPHSKGEFSQSLLMTWGVKGPLRLISHPHLLAELGLVPWCWCLHQGCGACSTHATMCPVPVQGMPQLLQRKSFQRTWIAQGLLITTLLLFYEALDRKGGLMVFFKTLMLILQLKTGFCWEGKEVSVVFGTNRWRYLAFAAGRFWLQVTFCSALSLFPQGLAQSLWAGWRPASCGPAWWSPLHL